jgi:hypothetical protein
LAGTLLFDEKIRQSAALFSVWMLEFFNYFSLAIIQRTIVDTPPFLEAGLAKKITVCAHTTYLPKK